MLVKLLCSRCHVEHGAQNYGEVIEVGEAEGERMIAAGQAEAVKETVKRGRKKAETATRKKKAEAR